MKRLRFCAVLLVGACAGAPSQPDPGALDAVVDRGGELRPGALDAAPVRVVRSRVTGAPELVRAEPGAHLVLDDASRPAPERARAFLADYGAVIGLPAADRAALPVGAARVVTDAAGRTHVRLPQAHDGIPVLGAEVVVHLDGAGVVAVNGTWVPDAAPAAARAATVDRTGPLAIVRTGLLAGRPGESRLARGAVEDDHQLWIDVETGDVLERYPLHHHAKHRVVYTPQYVPEQPSLFAVRTEGQGPTLLPPVDNLYEFSGHVHDMFAQAFGRDSFDGAGAIMRTVYLVDQNCPNAYWNGATTNYCPAFDLDDVVAHEWGHAYTEYTHGLIYAYQSGALNEAYSDIWGETIDLLNGVDGLGGANDDAPAPAGVRWAVGEDFGTGNGEYELLLRDMWDPERLGYPGHVTSASYACGAEDTGGVHTNSGVPNHAYALLVDGGTYRDVTVGGIGLVKAAHLYWQAQSAYQTPSTTFAQHADALEQSCADLLGTTVNGLFALPPETITADDCAQVANALLAVEMRTPVPCEHAPILQPGAPEACPGAAARVREDWSDGLAGWTSTSTGVNPEWPGYAWTVEDALPGGRTGRAAFAIDSTAGTCVAGGDYSGRFAIDSPLYTASGTGRLELRFDHFVETEAEYDGGNLLVSRNGGAFTLVPAAAYRWNGPGRTLAAAAPVGNNTNPKAGEAAWTGADEGGATGSWGTTVVDLSQLVAPGDTYRLRFDFGIDGCNGVTGWYVGALAVDECPTLAAPVISLGADYSEPDPDGRYTVAWARPAGATGPDELQESTVSCAPRLADDAQAGLGQWTAATTGLGALAWAAAGDKPGHGSTAFRTLGLEGVGNGAATLTTRAPVALPEGAVVTLRWKDWYLNEPDDRGLVEVSADGGATWTIVHAADRALQAGTADAAFLTEPLAARSVDLSGWAGRSVLLRFRYQLGASNFFLYKPIGWWIDDVAIDASRWTQVYRGGKTSKRLTRPPGTACYRARTSYAPNGVIVPGAWSGVVTARVQ